MRVSNQTIKRWGRGLRLAGPALATVFAFTMGSGAGDAQGASRGGEPAMPLVQVDYGEAAPQ